MVPPSEASCDSPPVRSGLDANQCGSGGRVRGGCSSGAHRLPAGGPPSPVIARFYLCVGSASRGCPAGPPQREIHHKSKQSGGFCCWYSLWNGFVGRRGANIRLRHSTRVFRTSGSWVRWGRGRGEKEAAGSHYSLLLVRHVGRGSPVLMTEEADVCITGITVLTRLANK